MNASSLEAETLPLVEEPIKVPRRMASHFSSATTLTPSGRNGLESGAGVQAGKNIELLFGSRPQNTQSSTGLADQNNVLYRQSQQSPSVEADYVIDPITNRKVYKAGNPTSLGDALVTPAIKSRFSGMESTPKSTPSPLVYSKPGPVFDPEFPITQRELERYAQPIIDVNPSGRDIRARDRYYCNYANGVATRGRFAVPASETYNDLSKYKPVMDKAPPAPEDLSKEYEDLEEYQPVMTERTPVAEDPSAQYKDLDKYKPVFEERTPVTDDPSMGYTDLDQYTPVSDVEQIPSPHEKEIYRDLPKYSKPYPDVENQSNPYEKEVYQDLHLYASPFPDVIIAPNPYEKEIYDDLHLYAHGFAYCEPDGQPPAPKTYEKETYSDLGAYNAFRYNEPDGKPTESHQAETERYTDLADYSQGYRASEPNGRYARQHTDVRMNESEISQEIKDMNLGYTEPGSEGPISKATRAVSNLFNMGSVPRVYERSWGVAGHSKISN